MKSDTERSKLSPELLLDFAGQSAKGNSEGLLFSMTQLAITELNERMGRFRACMGAEHRKWELVAILGRVNQYYFTGTSGQNWGTDEEKPQTSLNRY